MIKWLIVAATTISMMMVGIPARADQYRPMNGTVFARNCLGKEAIGIVQCGSRIWASVDIYFLLNPNCPRPESKAFSTAMISSIENRLLSMTEEQRAQITAAGLVYEIVSQIVPCEASSNSSAPDKGNCSELIKLLGNEYLDEAQKQAILLMLQNRGCLN